MGATPPHVCVCVCAGVAYDARRTTRACVTERPPAPVGVSKVYDSNLLSSYSMWCREEPHFHSHKLTRCLNTNYESPRRRPHQPHPDARNSVYTVSMDDTRDSQYNQYNCTSRLISYATTRDNNCRGWAWPLLRRTLVPARSGDCARSPLCRAATQWGTVRFSGLRRGVAQ
jgi:hypothetical protein